MDLQSFLQQAEPKAAKDTALDAPIFTELLADATSHRVPLDLMPGTMRIALDEAAGGLLDPEGRRMIVMGGQCSGKTFLVEQLAYNLDHYLELTSHGPLHIIRMNEAAMMAFGSMKELKARAQAYMESLGLQSHNMCFYTESPELGLYLSNVLPQWRIILEVNTSTLQSILESVAQTTSKAWYSWSQVDMDDVCFTHEELITMMELSVVKRLNALYPSKKITKRQIETLFRAASLRFGDLTNDLGRVRVSAGVWAVMLREIAPAMVFTTDERYLTKGGTPSFAKLSQKVLDAMDDFFQEKSFDDDLVSAPAQLMARMTEELNEFLQGESGEEKITPPENVEPLKFKSVSTLGKRLKANIFGQDAAVDAVASGFVVPAAGLNDTSKPVRSLLFLGPTGVGKTQLTLNLAQELTEKPLHVIRIDMSEYQQDHEVAKLFGAPPGYIGYNNGGILTSAVMEHPHSLILLDEVEKAHPKVWDSFLQVLDAGTMTDSQGNVVDFTKTVLVMTSNIGAREVARPRVGFFTPGDGDARAQEVSHIAKKAVEDSFRPEFINRIDEVVLFQEMTQEVAQAVVRREIDLVNERMAPRGHKILEPSPEVVAALVKKADIARYGAREVQRIVFKAVASPAAHIIVSRGTPQNLVLTLTDDEVRVVEAKRKSS